LKHRLTQRTDKGNRHSWDKLTHKIKVINKTTGIKTMKHMGKLGEA